jgi:hypothetical protein
LKRQNRRNSKRKGARATADDHAQVTYPVARARFLEAEEQTDQIEWLVAVGRYVQDRWLAEEAARDPVHELDEHAVWDEWDKFTEKQYRDLRAEAGLALKEYVDRKSWRAIRAMAKEKLKPFGTCIGILKWMLDKGLGAIVGALAIIGVAILLAWLMPDFVRRGHSTLDALLKPSPAVQGPAGAVNSQ